MARVRRLALAWRAPFAPWRACAPYQRIMAARTTASRLRRARIAHHRAARTLLYALPRAAKNCCVALRVARIIMACARACAYIAYNTRAYHAGSAWRAARATTRDVGVARVNHRAYAHRVRITRRRARRAARRRASTGDAHLSPCMVYRVAAKPRAARARARWRAASARSSPRWRSAAPDVT